MHDPAFQCIPPTNISLFIHTENKLKLQKEEGKNEKRKKKRIKNKLIQSWREK